MLRPIKWSGLRLNSRRSAFVSVVILLGIPII